MHCWFELFIVNSMEDKPSFWQYVIMGGIPFGAIFGTSMGIFGILMGMPSLHSILWIGLSSGLLFGLAIAFFTNSVSIIKQTSVELPPDESLILAGPANHLKTVEARGGRLYLTNRNLMFQPHKINFQTSPMSISVKDISEAKTSWTFWIVPNGLVIKTKDHASERFVVNSPGKWRKAIMPLIA